MHCLHTQTQLPIDSVLSSRGEIFYFLFYLFTVVIIVIVILFIVLYHFKQSLTILSLQEKNLYIQNSIKKKRKYEYLLFLVRKALKVYVVSSGHITMYRCDLILCKNRIPYSHGSHFGSVYGRASPVHVCAPVVGAQIHIIPMSQILQ